MAMITSESGKMVKSTTGFAWGFSEPRKSKVVLYSKVKEMMVPKSLHAVIGDTKAKSLSKHGEFPPGVPPKIFTKSEGYAFVISDPIVAAAMEAAQAIGSIEIYWVVRHDTAQHTLVPQGLLLMNAKQVIVPAGGTPWQLL
eukprot:11176660-Lingulodinium_polyedra.AAC.1